MRSVSKLAHANNINCTETERVRTCVNPINAQLLAVIRSSPTGYGCHDQGSKVIKPKKEFGRYTDEKRINLRTQICYPSKPLQGDKAI